MKTTRRLQRHFHFLKTQYHVILNRDPDANGLVYYMTHLLNQSMTYDQVTFALNNSDEKKAIVQQQLRQCYLNTLMREPDPQGELYYTRQVMSGVCMSDVIQKLKA